MIFDNLMKSLLTAAEIEVDSRWKQWAKIVKSVDRSSTNGYAFIGPFVNKGTVEIPDTELPMLVLVVSEVGSNKYRTTYYQVVRIESDGSITKLSGLRDDSRQQGWALRLRDKVAAEL